MGGADRVGGGNRRGERWHTATASAAAKERAFIGHLDDSPGCPDGAGHLTIHRVTTVFSAFERTARAHGAKPFLQFLPDKVEYRYGEALEAVQGDRAALWGGRLPSRAPRRARSSRPRPEFLLHFLALNSLGAAVVPLNPEARDAERAYVVEPQRGLRSRDAGQS